MKVKSAYPGKSPVRKACFKMECKHESFGRRKRKVVYLCMTEEEKRALKRRPARWREAWAYSWLHQLSFFKLGLLFSINIGEEKLQQVFISHLWKRNVKRILKNVLLSIRGDGKWNDLVRSKRKCRAHLFLMMHILWNLRNFLSAFPFVS